MPTAITSGSSTFNIADSGFFFMHDDVVLVTTGSGITINANDVDLFVNGTIFSDGRGIDVGLFTSGIDATIGSDANVVSVGVGVNFTGADSALTNHGSIHSLNLVGVNLSVIADNASFANFGSVMGEEAGLQFSHPSSSQFGVNHGAISGETGVLIERGSHTFINHGTVTGSSTAGGVGAYGVEFLVAVAGSTIYNTGTITGATASIFAETGADGLVIKNFGTLVGDVIFADGNDVYEAGDDGIVLGTIFGNSGDDTIIGGNSADDILGGDDNDSIIGNGGADELLGGFGFDTILGGTGDDTISGDAGSDFIKGGTGDDSITGGSGVDFIRGGAGDDSIAAGTEDDFVLAGAGNDEVSGDAGNDFIGGGGGADLLDGSGGNDTINGGGDDDSIFGGNNRDVLSGNKGDDALDGGGDRDTLDGGQGNDVLTGGAGRDVFVFGRNAGDDVVTDFTLNIDRIDLSAYDIDIAIFNAANAATFQLNTATIDLEAIGGSGSIIVESANFGEFFEQDFIF